MSIRLIARELYRLQRRVDQLEEKLAQTPILEREAIKEELRKARAERDHMRRVLDGQKDSSTA